MKSVVPAVAGFLACHVPDYQEAIHSSFHKAALAVQAYPEGQSWDSQGAAAVAYVAYAGSRGILWEIAVARLVALLARPLVLLLARGLVALSLLACALVCQAWTYRLYSRLDLAPLAPRSKSQSIPLRRLASSHTPPYQVPHLRVGMIYFHPYGKLRITQMG